MQPVGTPCWIDLQTDLDQARTFYGAVLGWSYEPMLGDWVVAKVGDAPVAALGPGKPRDWQVFLRTDGIEATLEAARQAGAEVTIPANALAELGTAAQIQPPHGATVGLWQADQHPGFSTSGVPGTPVWFETNTWSADPVEAFYAGLFELPSERMEGMDYRVISAEDAPRFGVLQMTDEWKGMDPSWMVYFAVESTDVGIERVKAAGGEVLYGAFDTPFGRMAVCRDPLGSAFSIIEPRG